MKSTPKADRISFARVQYLTLEVVLRLLALAVSYPLWHKQLKNASLRIQKKYGGESLSAKSALSGVPVRYFFSSLTSVKSASTTSSSG